MPADAGTGGTTHLRRDEHAALPGEVRYRYKAVRVRPRRRALVVAKWRERGWEVAAWQEGEVGSKMILRKEVSQRRRRLLPLSVWLVMGMVAILLITFSGILTARDYFSELRADARAAVNELKGGDVAALEKHLVAYRGQPDFAHHFASNIGPRDVGDALGTVAGPGEDAPFRAGLEPHAYELLLTDLAGTLALATHGIGDRALPESWTDDFIAATTAPLEMYGERDGFFDKEGRQRERQDLGRVS